jgi:hypothetical protein
MEIGRLNHGDTEGTELNPVNFSVLSVVHCGKTGWAAEGAES